MSVDYKVNYCHEQTLASVANRLRKQARCRGRFTIDMVDLIQRVLVNQFADRGGLRIDIFEGDRYDDPACVTYNPLTLHVRQVIWEQAREGFASAYFILAHEIAHLLFHDHKALAFSRDPSLRLRFVENEYKAEWQADTFAKHLTIPDSAILQIRDPELLAFVCNVEASIVTERLDRYGRTGPMLRSSYEGDPCEACGNFTLVREGGMVECDTCGPLRNKRIAGQEGSGRPTRC